MGPSFFAHLSHSGPSEGDFKASRRNCMQHSHITLVTAKCFQVDNCAEAWLWYLILPLVGGERGRQNWITIKHSQ